jgi:phosphoribosylaminoimidazolecarboxamide formyltransferase / IMP cyclohydrolase
MGIRCVEQIDDRVSVKNVFCSVTDKGGLADVIKRLIKFSPEIKIFSTGDTFSHLQKELGEAEADSHLVEVSDYTGMPETAGGLVKSLHHKLFLGYLTDTYYIPHLDGLKREEAVPIDLVIVNLYDFKKAAVDDGNPINLELARSNIDVDGSSALRAAAKNWLRVMTLPTPNDYGWFLDHLEANGGVTTYAMRYPAATKTFRLLSEYDGAIAHFFVRISFKETMRAYKVNNPSDD